MKAIHNVRWKITKNNFVGNYKLKYNFESNSQPTTVKNNAKDVGNYKLKYNFESNSQLSPASFSIYTCWEL